MMHTVYPRRRGLWLVCLLQILLCILTTRIGFAQELTLPLSLGDGVVTRFSGSIEFLDNNQVVSRKIDARGSVVKAIGLSQMLSEPVGQHFLNESQAVLATAAQIGQVFGIAFDDQEPANIYLTATSAFGLHLDGIGGAWADGLWGQGGGPGTIWKLNASNGYKAEIFSEVTLDRRQNSGPALGNIAFNPYHQQLLVSDLETGMIHSYSVLDGSETDRYDHGLEGRAAFLDIETGSYRSLPVTEFDPQTSANRDDCREESFSFAPQCWNLADFRRRVWGLGLSADKTSGEIRLFYALWSNAGFDSPGFEGADAEERTNSVWSIALDESGAFDASSVRREFLVPPSQDGDGDDTFAISDIAFPKIGIPNILAIARNRGVITGIRGSSDVSGLPWPGTNWAAAKNGENQLWKQGDRGIWGPSEIYGEAFNAEAYFEREGRLPLSIIGQNAAGGVDFGQVLNGGTADPEAADGSLWFTANHLCSQTRPCFSTTSRAYSDIAEVHGLFGLAMPEPANGGLTALEGSFLNDRALAIDIDRNVDDAGNIIITELTRAGPGIVGDIEILRRYKPFETGPLQTTAQLPPTPAWPNDAPDAPWWPEPLKQSDEKGLDLAIQKAATSECKIGKQCNFVLVISNIGSTVYDAGLRIADQMPPGWKLGASGPAGSGWLCVEFAGEVVCENTNFTLDAGATDAVSLDMVIPKDAPLGNYQNCASIRHLPAINDRRSNNDKSCVTVPLGGGETPGEQPNSLHDLQIVKTGDTRCKAGETCNFNVQINNTGKVEFNGTLSFVDFFPDGWSYSSSGKGWWCMLMVGGGDRFSCWRQQALMPGESTALNITLNVPETPGLNIANIELEKTADVRENCAELDWTRNEADGNPGNDRDCAEVKIVTTEGPPATGLDLALTKTFNEGPTTGPAATIKPTCEINQPCNFRIGLRIENVGTQEYVGQVVVHDLLPLGWQFLSGQGALDCAATGSILACSTLKKLTLQPNEAVQASLEVQSPPIEKATKFSVRNCAQISWSGKPDGNKANDVSCAETLVEVIERKPDLHIRKSGPESCEPGEPCAFTIEVENIGNAPFEGPIKLVENDDRLFEISSYSGGNDAFYAWNCGSDLAAPPGQAPQVTVITGEIRCQTGNLKLEAGQKAILRLVLIVAGSMEKERTHYQNCVKFAEDPDDDGIDEVGCHTFRLVPDWDLTITKTSSSWCYGQKTDPCNYSYAITNVGSTDYSGPISIVDNHAKDLALWLPEWSPEKPTNWTCKSVADGEWRCNHPAVTLKAGETLDDILKVTMQFGKDTPEDLEVITNVATVKYIGGPPDANPDNDSDSATVVINHSKDRTVTGESKLCSPLDIVTELLGLGNDCYTGNTQPKLDLNGDGTIECRGPACTFYEFTIVNSGAMNYTGDMRLNVTLPEGAHFISAHGVKSGLACKADRWLCHASGNKAVCQPKKCVLGADEETSVRFDVKLLPTPAPDLPAQGIKMTTCAELTWDTPASINPIEQRPSETSISSACQTTLVLPEKQAACPEGQKRDAAGECVLVVEPLDLAIKKKAIGDCNGKQTCRFQIAVVNNSNQLYKGMIAITDTLSNSKGRLRRTFGEASCKQSGSEIACMAGPLTLEKGRPFTLSLDINLPELSGNRRFDNCATLVWADTRSSETLTRNDVRILQQALARLGYDPGPIDGVIGRGTRAAVARAAAAMGIKDNKIDTSLLSAILSDGSGVRDQNPTNDRSCASVTAPQKTVKSAPKPYQPIQSAPQKTVKPKPKPKPYQPIQSVPQKTFKPPEPTRQIRCDGGVPILGLCVCPPNFETRRLSGNRGFQCVPITKRRPEPTPAPKTAPSQPDCPPRQVYSHQAGRCIDKPTQVNPNFLRMVPTLPKLKMMCPAGEVWVEKYKKCLPQLR